jgi:hypothetical protein
LVIPSFHTLAQPLGLLDEAAACAHARRHGNGEPVIADDGLELIGAAGALRDTLDLSRVGLEGSAQSLEPRGLFSVEADQRERGR